MLGRGIFIGGEEAPNPDLPGRYAVPKKHAQEIDNRTHERHLLICPNKAIQEVVCLAVAHPDASLLVLDPLRYATLRLATPTGVPPFIVLITRRVKTLTVLYLDSSPGQGAHKMGP